MADPANTSDTVELVSKKHILQIIDGDGGFLYVSMLLLLFVALEGFPSPPNFSPPLVAIRRHCPSWSLKRMHVNEHNFN
jgi:hypothetical protein